MAKRRIPDQLRRVNAAYVERVNYYDFYRLVLTGQIAAERDPTGRFWLIDDAEEANIAGLLGLTPKPPRSHAA